MVVHHHSRTLTMFRVQMCSSGHGTADGGTTGGGGLDQRPRTNRIIALLFFSITGCEDKRASLEKQYAEARLLFQQGYIDQPLPLAEAGYRESAEYPDLNWKFRVLTAEARNRKQRYDAALEILEPEPPSNIPSEIFWRRQNHSGFCLFASRANTRKQKNVLRRQRRCMRNLVP